MAERVLYDVRNAIFTRFFKKADDDGNGYLDVNELAGVIESRGMEVQRKAILEIFIAIDTNGDWKISLEEFLQVMNTLDLNIKNGNKADMRRTEKTLCEMRNAIFTDFFQDADKNGNGYMEIEELSTIIGQYDIHSTRKEIADVFIAMDEDGDWQISKDECLKVMNNLERITNSTADKFGVPPIIAKLRRELFGVENNVHENYMAYDEVKDKVMNLNISEDDLDKVMKRMHVGNMSQVNLIVFVDVFQRMCL